MSKFKIIFDGYEEPDEYDSYDEALEAADVMASDFQIGTADLYNMNHGDYIEEADGDGSYVIIEVDENGIEIDRY